MSQEQNKKVDEYLKHGLTLAANAMSTIAGFAAGDQTGLIATVGGGVLAPLATEMADRLLSRKEKTRTSEVIIMAAILLKEAKESGREIRDDALFRDALPQSAEGEELLEGILLVAQREHQEKKLKFLAHLLKCIALDREIDIDLGNYLISLAERLSYRQFCILELIERKDQYGLRTGDYEGHIFDNRTQALIGELMDLFSYGLVVMKDNPSDMDEAIAGDAASIVPSELYLGRLGILLSNALNLADIRRTDTDRVAEMLK